MTFKELQDFATENPESLEMFVVSSTDDEGNSYNPIHYRPSLGEYNSDDKEFISPVRRITWVISSEKYFAI